MNTSLRQDEGANGRQLSPPVSKDEMTSEDLISIHTASGEQCCCGVQCYGMVNGICALYS